MSSASTESIGSSALFTVIITEPGFVPPTGMVQFQDGTTAFGSPLTFSNGRPVVEQSLGPWKALQDGWSRAGRVNPIPSWSRPFVAGRETGALTKWHRRRGKEAASSNARSSPY